MRIGRRAERWVVISIFLLILVAGVLLFDDYGVSVDEPTELWTARYNYDLIKTTLHIGSGVDRDPGFDEYMFTHFSLNYYGVALQLPTLFLESALRSVADISLSESDHYLLRHFYTFCIYYTALICFYFLLKNLFGGRWLAVTGVLMLLLFGRVFAQSFYNIKDMLFLSVMVWLFLVTERMFATGRSVRWCALYTLVAALAVNVRIVGALWIILTLIAMLIQDIAIRKSGAVGEGDGGTKRKPRALPYVLICLSYPCWLLLTPCAWENPVKYTIDAIRTFLNYVTFQGTILYNGREIPASQTPWTYVLCWIGMTVPLVNSGLSLLGMGVFTASAVRRRGEKPYTKPHGGMTLAMLLTLLAGTLGYQMLCRPIIYNGWRHMFFLYPIIVVFAVYGIAFLLDIARRRRSALLRVGVIAAVAGSLAFNAAHIAWSHPYEYATYNIIGMRVSKRFDRDYWKLSNRQAFRYLLDTVQGDIRLVCLDGAYEPFLTGEQIFEDEERARLIFAGTLADAEYAVINCRNLVDTNEITIAGFSEIYSVDVDGVKLCSVQKRVAGD